MDTLEFRRRVARTMRKLGLRPPLEPFPQTPWTRVTGSKRTRFHGLMSRRDANRYRAVQLQLMRLSEHTEAVQDVAVAQGILQRGPQHGGPQPFFNVPASEAPRVSIVIPVMNQFAVTRHCLASLVMAVGKQSVEVILVDDASTDETCRIEEHIGALRVLRNESNLGYLHSCNRGAALARGEFLMMLNNDTEVGAACIDELVAVLDEIPEAGAAGAKLEYPDGTLQDGGGLVFNNGTPWNAGHGAHPDHPLFNYRRDADYLTGAALLVRREIWNALGGYDPGYAPAYYEDTDLAFRIREAGWRTLYCPQATVVHFEGMSNGTDLEAGIKRYQQINAARFVQRWQGVFATHGPEGEDLLVQLDRDAALRVLVIDHAFPCVGQDAGSHAAMQEVGLLQALGARVTFLPMNFQYLEQPVDQLQRKGVECVYSPFEISLDEFLARRGAEFDAVYITRYYVAEWALPALRKHTHAKLLYNNADLHHLREWRALEVAGADDFSSAIQTREREVAVMHQADVILSYNEHEHEVIADLMGGAEHIMRTPWVQPICPTDTGYAERSGLCFLGGFRHPPNLEALVHLAEVLMPALAAVRPDIHLHVYGSAMDDRCHALAAPNLHVHGFAESLDVVFAQRRVFVAPLRSGAGIKGKVLDAMAHGVPTVLSNVAAEGIGLIDGESARIVERTEDWVAAVIELYDAAPAWHQTRKAALQLLAQHYSYSAGISQMRKILEHVELPFHNTEIGASSDERRVNADVYQPHTSVGADELRRAA